MPVIQDTYIQGHRQNKQLAPQAGTYCKSHVVCNEFEHINAMKTDPLAKI